VKKLFLFVLLAPATAFAHPGHGAQISKAPLLALTGAAVALAAWGWAKARAHDQG